MIIVRDLLILSYFMFISAFNRHFYRRHRSRNRYIQLSTGARSHSIIFHRCNFSSFSRQFGRASRGKYPRGLRSSCKINNLYRRFRFSFRSASRVMCLFHFYYNEATSLHRSHIYFFFLILPISIPFYSIPFLNV